MISCRFLSKFSLLSLIFVATASLPALAEAKVKVVATVGDLGAVASEVGGDDVSVHTLANPGEDPHFVDAKPSFVKQLAGADLLVYNGASLEIGWLPTLLKGSRNADIQSGAAGNFDASSNVKKMGVPTGKVSRAAGDIHPEGNPHFTPDPRQMAQIAVALGKKLGEVDPKNAEQYRARANDFARRSLQQANKWSKEFAKLPKTCRNVAVYHEAWAYVLDWLDLNSVIALEPKPGVPPNPKHVAKVFKTLSDKDVRAILQMSFYPTTISENVAKKSGAKLIKIQGQTKRGQSYFKRVDEYAGALYSALKAGCK